MLEMYFWTEPSASIQCAGFSDCRGAGGRGQLVLQQVQAPCAGQQEAGPLGRARGAGRPPQALFLHTRPPRQA